MKKLIITAHPSSIGFTHKIASRYKDGAISVGDTVDIIDLYDKKYRQDFLSFEDIRFFGDDKVRDIFHKKITEAEELVFVFPIWWGGFPAILKNFFDTNFSTNFAFKYSAKGQEGLLKGKKATVIATCDAPGFIYKLFVFPLRLKGYLSLYLLGFCGIKLKSFTLFSTMRKKKNDLIREKMLKKVYNLALKK